MSGSTKGMKKRTLVLGVAAALVAAGIVVVLRGGIWFPQGAVAQAPSGGQRPVAVEVARAAKKAVPLRVEALGTVTPIKSVAIKARLETMITEVHFEDGALVKEGDLLFTLDGRQIEAEIKRVQAIIAGALAQLQQAERDVQRYSELVAKNATTVVTLHQRLKGEGPPKTSGSGRGDIHYRVKLEVPRELNDEQREAVEKLAEAFNGDDPRRELLDRAGRPGGKAE